MEAKTSILERLRAKNFPVSEIESWQHSKYRQQLYQIIMDSPSLCEEATKPWAYKSLWDVGVHSYVLQGEAYDWTKPSEFFDRAIKELSFHVVRNIWYHDEGLPLYCKNEAGNFMEARKGQRDYDFVTMAEKSGVSLDDLRLHECPGWAANLYLNHEAQAAYQLVWCNENAFPELTYEEWKEARRNLVREIVGDASTMLQKASYVESEKTVSTKERNTLLAIIGVLCKAQGYDLSQPRKAGDNLESMGRLQGVGITGKTIAGYLKEVPAAMQARPSKD